jgi:uncharacterized 2Fe-2S/4Fe-4S cluster protein (DUF4445 family)
MEIKVATTDGPRTIRAEAGEDLLTALRREGFPVTAPCGGRGTCGKCKVQVRTGEGWETVLACQTQAREGITVRLPDPRALVVESAQGELDVSPDPGLTGYGIACDIGTTTVVCHLVELSTGAILSTAGEGNAQRPYGDDVIGRIRACMDGQRPALTGAIRGQLSRMIQALCGQAGVAPEALSRMAVAANTTMCHLLAGLAPDSIGLAPFTPLSLFGKSIPAKDLELPFQGEVYIAPAVAGYVGGDITADLLSAGLDRAAGPVLLLDVGTNGEMALGCGEHFLCCATAAGPTFEGAQITCGMTAAPGAVSVVEWENGAPTCTVLGGGEAVGLCGSGLIDAMALLLDLGVVDETGRMLDPEEDDVPPAAAPFLFLADGSPAFRLTEKVWVTQGDVRRLQLAKGAIAAGIQVLADAYGLGPDGLSALLLAGGFGSYIRPVSAARIGLIPQSFLPVTRSIGNAAAQGARAALISKEARVRLDRLQTNMEYVELSGLAAFNDAYMDAMLFPEEESE